MPEQNVSQQAGGVQSVQNAPTSSLPSTSTDGSRLPLAGLGSILMAIGLFLMRRYPRRTI